MASAGLYKMGRGEVAVSNCFPPRNLLRLSNGSAGHWLMAHKTTPEGRFRALVCSASSDHARSSDLKNTSTTGQQRRRPSHRTLGNQECVMDGPFLMKTHFVERPDDLCSVNVSDRNLTSAHTEDFLQFTCVAYMNASENRLLLEDFSTFPMLRELDISLNEINRIHIKQEHFPNLEVLDLSYNNLSPDDISQLGVLPQLRVLHLTGNRLTHLPPDMSGSHCNDLMCFPSLEILMLDDNRLSQASVFGCLANLKRLHQLNLDKNGITEIPYLLELDLDSSMDSPPGKTRTKKQPTPGGSISHSKQSKRENNKKTSEEDRFHETDKDIDYIVFPNADDPDRTDILFTSIDRPHTDRLPEQAVTTQGSSLLPDFDPAATDRTSQQFSPPLPNLRFLSLANNKIAYEENLLAAALFPSLEELVIHGNPLVTLRKGDSPLLKTFFQERLGIRIIRRRMPEPPKPRIYISINEQRKVNEHVPKIPKQPLMLESPSTFLNLLLSSSDQVGDGKDFRLPPSPLPPIKSSQEERDRYHKMNQEPMTVPETEDTEDADSAVESVFMTQADEVSNSLHITSPISPCNLDKEMKEDVVVTQKDIPEKFKGYEVFLDVQTDPSFIEPVGIQSNVRALEKALKHLHILRDFKPRLRSIQKPFTHRETKLGKDPLLSFRKTKKELVKDIIINMREQRHVTEKALESDLQNENSSKEYKNAQQLLNQLQDKYRSFYTETVKRANELETSLKETAKKLQEAERQLGNI
ncbi:X-ray radiation resistance-associated protein 1 [Pelobates fuscus]|uniref:X-ray radiation resistance-associated protein 1 n=1 Tax=Pelobates fuscus TaxID=191477 RepID=UPI002FE472D4